MKLRYIFLSMVTVVALAGCASNISPSSHSSSSAGQLSRTTPGVVVSVRPVEVNNASNAGTAIGAVAGGVAGSRIGGSTRANVLGGIGGAVVGGLLGGAIERGTSSQEGMEYVVEFDNGNLFTLIQGPEENIRPGDRVLVVQGNPARIILDRR